MKGAVLLLSYPILYHNPPVAEAAQISAPKISPKAVIGVDSMIIGDITIADDVFIGLSLSICLGQVAIGRPVPVAILSLLERRTDYRGFSRRWLRSPHA